MILDNIVSKRLEQLEREKSRITLEELKKRLNEEIIGKNQFALTKMINSREFTLIAEVKKASPSKGIIRDNFAPAPTAIAYENAGAGAVSVLTEEAFFLGKNGYLIEIANSIKIPILRKDFIIDPYQIYHSRYLGASAILLIVAILDKDRLAEFLQIAKSIGLDAIVEVHTEDELKIALEVGAEIIGINNRNLKTFEEDLTTTEHLMKLMQQPH